MIKGTMLPIGELYRNWHWYSWKFHDLSFLPLIIIFFTDIETTVTARTDFFQIILPSQWKSWFQPIRQLAPDQWPFLIFILPIGKLKNLSILYPWWLSAARDGRDDRKADTSGIENNPGTGWYLIQGMEIGNMSWFHYLSYAWCCLYRLLVIDSIQKEIGMADDIHKVSIEKKNSLRLSGYLPECPKCKTTKNMTYFNITKEIYECSHCNFQFRIVK